MRLLGLKGGSSHTFDLVDVFLPDHYVLEGRSIIDMNVDAGTPGLEVYVNPRYGGRGIAFFAIALINLAVGGATAALDEYEQLTEPIRRPPRPSR